MPRASDLLKSLLDETNSHNSNINSSSSSSSNNNNNNNNNNNHQGNDDDNNYKVRLRLRRRRVERGEKLQNSLSRFELECASSRGAIINAAIAEKLKNLRLNRVADCSAASNRLPRKIFELLYDYTFTFTQLNESALRLFHHYVL
ncbi:hypothetical protein V9T40_007516 [Parthenolecanium corni]|uniref:Uncharacterized protein n=1 Tax=Parthenolecanium corni TaxID=536013 RepID=A0AAN9Y493_9HEMI